MNIIIIAITITIITVSIIIIQVGVAVYGRYATLSSPPVSYLAHISGSVAGVTIGEILFISYASSSILHSC